VNTYRQAAISWSRAAELLDIPRRTLAHWDQQERAGTPPAPRGRPPKESPLDQYCHGWDLMKREGCLSVATLQHETGLARCAAFDLQRDFWTQLRAAYCEYQQKLTWLRPGSVWAVDHTEPQHLVDGTHRYLLAVRDLVTGRQLAWAPVASTDAPDALKILEALFDLYGAPLVLKSDNGPAFKSDLWAECLARRKVVRLRSWAYTPRYNGAIEAAIQAMQGRTEHFAARAGRPTFWTSEDLAAALHQANCLHRPDDRPHATAQELWQARAPLNEVERAVFYCAVEERWAELESQRAARKSARGECPSAQRSAKLEREAACWTLVKFGLLSTTWRPIHLPLRPDKLARLT
jgi:transposase InsO family protein